MKITHCILNIDKTSGGPSRSLPNLCKMLAQEKENISLVCYKSSDINFSALQENGVNLQLVDKGYTLIEYLRNQVYLKAIDKISPDILHGHNLWTPCLHHMASYARKKGIPYILSPRGCLEPWSLSQSALKKKIAYNIYQENDLQKAFCIHATSQMEAMNIYNLGIKAPLVVIPNGVDVKYYQEKDYHSEISKKKKTVLFVSRIHPKKGIHILIDVWSRLSPRIREAWNLDIVGTPNDPRYLNQLIELCKQKEGLENSVRFLPPLFGKEKVEKYQQADVFVLPTFSENFGMVIAEALACGTPVITTKGTPWESLNTNNCGWWIDLNVESLYDTLLEAINLSDDERISKGKRGRQFIEKTSSLDVVCNQYIQLYQWVSGNIPKPQFVIK